MAIKNFNIPVIIIFIIALTLRICYINTKTSMYIDSPVSFVCATPNNLSPEGSKVKKDWSHVNFSTGINYKVSEVKKTLFFADPSIKSIFNDIFTLYFHSMDYAHTNMYYSILRVWITGLDGKDYKTMINRGCFLNVIFFCLSFFFLYRLLNLIKNDKKFIELGLFFGFLSTASISITLLIRSYALMQLFFVIACYIFTYIYISLIKNKPKKWQNIVITRKNFILFSFGLALFCLTGYLSIALIGILFFILLIKSLKEKTFKIKPFACFVLILIGFIYVFYPNFLQMGNSEHAKLLQIPLIEYFKAFLNFRVVGHNLMFYLINFLFYNISIYVVIYILNFFGIPLVNNKNALTKDEINISIMLALIAFIWIFIAYIICPYKEFPTTLRYIAPAFPILSIILILLTYNLKKWLFIIVLLLFLYSSCTTTYNKGIIFYNENNALNINNLPVIQNKKIPIVIVFKNLNQAWYSFVMYMDNDKTIRFEDNIPNKNYDLKEYVLITSDTLKVENYEPLNLYGENIYYIKNN